MDDKWGVAHSETSDKFQRFPIPDFDRHALKDMDWAAPTFLSETDAAKLIERREAGDASAYGCYPVMPSEAFFAKLDVRGDHRHAVLCLLPDREVRILGRSYAWYIQKMWLVDSLDPDAHGVVAARKTPRPMNTRLGPTDGIVQTGGVLYAIATHQYADHWIGNRTILDNAWGGGDGQKGFRILSSSMGDGRNFHDCNLEVAWTA